MPVPQSGPCFPLSGAGFCLRTKHSSKGACGTLVALWMAGERQGGQPASLAATEAALASDAGVCLPPSQACLGMVGGERSDSRALGGGGVLSQAHLGCLELGSAFLFCVGRGGLWGEGVTLCSGWGWGSLSRAQPGV